MDNIEDMFNLTKWMDDIDVSEFSVIPGGFKRVKLVVNIQEGDYIPHFHFYHDLPENKGVPNDKRKGGGCICFLEAKYFLHGTHKEKMTSSEIKEMIKFLKKKHEKKNYTNWEVMINEWNKNKKFRIKTDIPIPNYKYDMGNVTDKED